MTVSRSANLQPEALFEGILASDRVALGRAITLVESQRPDRKAAAARLIELCSPVAAAQKTFRLAVSGAPGAGKSTFIEALGVFCIEKKGEKIAVLAIDPSSSISGGSILGDKTRMEKLSTSPLAFVRPSPAGAELGGVARKTRETIIVCEAAGYRNIIVETVGVGQSETAAASMTDCFLLLLLPGAGDELQGIKRGISEMADLVAVNKADGERALSAKQAAAFYRNALHLFPSKASGQQPQALTCSALTGEGIEAVAGAVADFEKAIRANGFFEKNRAAQARFWLREAVEAGLRDAFFNDEAAKQAFETAETSVALGKTSPFGEAEKLLKAFFQTAHRLVEPILLKGSQ